MVSDDPRLDNDDRRDRGPGRARPIDILIVDPGVARAQRPDDQWLAKRLQHVLSIALTPGLRDDRFDRWTAPDGLMLALALDGDEPVGFLGGGIEDGRIKLDGLLAADRADGANGAMLATALYRSLDTSITNTSRGPGAVSAVELWGRPAAGWHRSLAEHHGFDEYRALHQFRCTLPTETAPLSSRAFVPGQDDDALIEINNRAFATHPDQGNMSSADLAEATAQPWFNPDGIRLYDDPGDPGRLAGFCWTKIHEPTAPGEPRLGEIYVIGIDPDHHGKGLGVPMTAAGLTWLADQGLTTGMLYVEADNAPAIRTYEKLGFTLHRTDRAWSKRLGPPRSHQS